MAHGSSDHVADKRGASGREDADPSAKRARKEEEEEEEQEEKVAGEKREWHVILYYKYAEVEEPEALLEWHRAFLAERGLTGRVLVAREGVNGSLTGTADAVAAYTRAVEAMPPFRGIEWKRSVAVQAECPFPDTHLRLVREIINSGGRFTADMGPTGTYLEPREFHRKMLETPREELLVVDVRNHKEVMLGSFEGATDPKTRVFSEMPDWIDRNADKIRGARAALFFCTGGVRCVRTTQYVRAKLGVDHVYQLSGGIHRYLEEFKDGGLFRGKNFVFDRRGALAPEEAGEGGRAVVGKCYECAGPWDKLDSRAVCTVCRDALLACPPCRERLHNELHCETHAHLKGCYFTFLDVFGADELRAQRAELAAKLDALLGQRNKNRRRSLRRQIGRVDARLAELAAGAKVVDRDAAGARCRTCGSADCTGDRCWGFWKEGKTAPQPE